MPQTKPSWRRSSGRLRKAPGAQLPYDLNREMLAELAPEVSPERGAGRAVQHLVETVHGSFEHIRTEYDRLARYHGEHVDETNFLKDELLNHEDPQVGGTNAPGRGQAQLGNVSSCGRNPDYDFVCGLDTGIFVPVFVDAPTLVTNLGLIIAAKWRDIAHAGGGDLEYEHRMLHMAIYHANPNIGYFPDELAADMGLLDWSAAPDEAVDHSTGPEVLYWSEDGHEVELGPGWYWMGGSFTLIDHNGDVIGTTGSEDSGWAIGPQYNNTGAGLGGLFMTPYWPFPRLTNGETWGSAEAANETPIALSHLWTPGDDVTGDSPPPDRFGFDTGISEEALNDPWDLDSVYFYDQVAVPMVYYKGS